MTVRAGYAHPAYAEVFRDHGMPLHLPASGGSVLSRTLHGPGLRDAMGCYPIFCCGDWGQLGTDLEALGREHVSLVLVADPFHAPSEMRLRALFDHVTPFKIHHVAGLDQSIEDYVPKNRLRTARKALQKLTVEVVTDPPAFVGRWMHLQAEAFAERRPSGMNRLSREALQRMFEVPGVVLLHAMHEGKTVGMHVEFHQGDVVFGHFACYSREGNRCDAATALHVFEIEHFSGKARWIDWGGVPGEVEAATGLSHFKRDFSNTRRTAFLCGRIFDAKAYQQLAARLSSTPGSYFPAYRSGELT